MGYYINPSIGYYEGDQIDGADQAVLPRPDATRVWNGTEWAATTATVNAPILEQIAALESGVTPRRLREALLGADGGWLAGINAQIAALRAQLAK